MADIKLFRIKGEQAISLPATSMSVEKSLQTLIENHLEVLLGIRFLKTEYSTGKKHKGRIDTLGVDENGCPVIIEYKRAMNENVINQGLFYLDWLMDHQGEFTLAVQKKFGPKGADKIDWSSPRLVCIAGDFTKYDEHAVQQINRNIELIRYRRYGDDLLLLELVNQVAAASEPVLSKGIKKVKKGYEGTFVANYSKASSSLRDLFDEMKSFMVAMGDDVQEKSLKYYMAFKRIKNFACIEIHPQTKKVLVYVKIDPKAIKLEEGFTRDVRSIGHFGTGDLEITVGTAEDFEKAKPLLWKSYENN
jgi:predicted transport protein